MRDLLAMLVVALLSGVAVIASGCGGDGERGPTGTVSGKVVGPDGRPVTQGAINFTAPKQGVGAITPLSESGEFELEQPLPVGTYKVYFTPPAPPPPEPGSPPPPKQIPGVPRQYHSEQATPLSVEITEGKNPLTLELEK
jgi:hypothetical protein